MKLVDAKPIETKVEAKPVKTVGTPAVHDTTRSPSPGPRKQSVHGGAEAISRGRMATRKDAGVTTKATPAIVDPAQLPPRGKKR